MTFVSLEFALFLPIIFTLFWIAKGKLRIQNLIIVIGSYIFYGWWDYRFLALIFLSTLIDFSVAKRIGDDTRTKTKSKLLLGISLFANLGMLGVLKYYNFFVDSFTTAFTFFGHAAHGWTLNVILPVGISFYTFQTLSYTIDVYRGKLPPESNFLAFAGFVSFFPQLVAGPIERATHLLPQFQEARKFVYHESVDGLRQILWGVFKKAVIADNCAIYVNQIFADPAGENGSTLVLGSILFAIQIYGDFSGYSDIAIGTARLFGYDLRQNFAFPYFSRDIAEFWRRWHISLSTWFRDYLYIPLGGSRGSQSKKIRNVFIIFIVSGFWHGANWTFIIWGLLNALYFIPQMVRGTNRANLGVVAENRHLPTFKEAGQILLTFAITCIAWVFFRSPTVTDAFIYLSGIADRSILSWPTITPPAQIAMLLLAFVVVEWIAREYTHGLAWLRKTKSSLARHTVYYGLVCIIFLYAAAEQPFIYFQF